MEQIAFRMQLNPGQAEVYRQRHDDIWPELVTLLKQAGIADYSIFLHEPSHSLFAVLRRTPDHSMAALPQHAIMQRWWVYMADIMQTGDDRQPVVEPMERVFHLD
jgi:L-rhamnose mutarotase